MMERLFGVNWWWKQELQHHDGIMRDGERASEMGWKDPIGRGENHIAREAMFPSLVCAQKTIGDP